MPDQETTQGLQIAECECGNKWVVTYPDNGGPPKGCRSCHIVLDHSKVTIREYEPVNDQ